VLGEDGNIWIYAWAKDEMRFFEGERSSVSSRITENDVYLRFALISSNDLAKTALSPLKMISMKVVKVN